MLFPTIGESGQNSAFVGREKVKVPDGSRFSTGRCPCDAGGDDARQLAIVNETVIRMVLMALPNDRYSI